MTRVLILCEYASLNGGERSLLAVLGGLHAAGFDIVIVGPPTGDLPQAMAAAGHAYLPIELHNAAGTRLDLSICRRRLHDAIAGKNADLVHANSLSMSRLAGPVVAQLGLPSVGHIRDIVRVSAAVIADMNRHTRLLAVSAATRSFYTRAGVDEARVFVCYNGVDLQRFRPHAPNGFLHRELGLPEGVPLVGTVGQIGIRKGLHVLVQAAERVCTAMPAVHFVVFGRRYSQKAEAVQYERNLVQAASTGVLAGRLHFPGVREDMECVLNEVSVLAHAARQEPLGRVLLEAAACGRPVVATDVGGTREIFPDEYSAATIVSPDDPPCLANALLELLGDKALRQSMATAARRRAEQAFDARDAALALAAHYRAVLDGIDSRDSAS